MEATSMHRTPIRTAVVAAMLTLALALPGAAGAATRVPASPTVRQIVVVTAVVNGTNAWLDLVIAALPPNPCTPDPGPPEIDPVCLGFVGVLGAYEALGETVGDACVARPDDGLGDPVVTDAVAPASDLRTRLIVRQLNLITAVLGAANDRLIGILTPDPGPPEIAALAALYDAVGVGAVSVPPVDLDGDLWPPNPCIPPVDPDIGA